MRGIPGTNMISYHKKDKIYNIAFKKHGKYCYLGSSPTLIGALMMRDWCEANNWKPYPKNRNKSTGEKYIHHRKNSDIYEIVKTINGRREYFGRYHTLEEAVKWRDYFIEHDWDVNIRLIGSSTKNIYFKNNKYVIIKTINGREYYFGSFNTFEEAEKRVFEIQMKGWEKVIYENERLLETTVANIVYVRGKYMVVKYIDGVRETFGVFDTYAEAEREVRLLRKSNWDYSVLCECVDESEDGWEHFVDADKLMSTSFEKQKYRNDGFVKLKKISLF